MSAALELTQMVRANGGWMRVEGDSLVIAPDSAALQIIDELRQHKGEIIRLLKDYPAVPAYDPEAWRAPFAEWLHSACALHPRFSTSVSSLHIAFCAWEDNRDGVPCNRDTFIRLLRELDFCLGEADGLVSGLAFRDDLECMKPQLPIP